MGVYRKGSNFFIDYYANGRRKRERIGPSKALAKTIFKKRKVEIAENKFLDVQKEEKVRFRDFAELYLKNHSEINNKAWKKAESSYLSPTGEKSLVAYFGDKFLYEITPLMIEQYKRERREEVSPATINRTLQILSSMFNRAIDWGKAKENPMKKVKLYRLDNQRLRYFERAEIEKILNSCLPDQPPVQETAFEKATRSKRAQSLERLRAVVILALNTGMRKSEIQNLKWQDIDFQKNLICILEQKNGDKSYLPLNESAKQSLMSVRRYVDSPLVFCRSNGKSYNFRKAFETILEKCGIKGASFHTLRHSFASHLAMFGVDLNTIRELMRHKSLTMTQRYAHLSKDHKARAVGVLASQMDSFWTPAKKQSEFENLVSQIEINS